MMRVLKRILGIILIIIVLFESSPVLAKETSEINYYTIPYSTNSGKNGDLLVRVNKDKVWCTAQQLGSILGWNVTVGETGVTLKNENFNSQIIFTIKKNMVYKSWTTHVQEFKVPFECVKEQDKFWIPFDFGVIILDSFHLENVNGIYLSDSRWTILNVMSWVDKHSSEIMFDIMNEFGYTEWDQNLNAGCARLIDYAEMLKGILEGDGDTILNGIIYSASITDKYDKIYGEKFAKLMTINSDKELDSQIKQFGNMEALLSPEGKLASIMEKIDKDFVESSKTNLRECIKQIEKAEEFGTELSLQQCDAYQMYKKVIRDWDKFNEVDDFIADVQNECEKVGLEKASKVSKILEGISVISEFTNRDEFALNALEEYAYQAKECDYVPKVSLLMLQEKLITLNSTVVGYGFSEYIKKNVKEWVGETIGENIVSLTGKQKLVLLAWDLMEDYVPFLKNGLSSAENMELYLYAYCFQSSAANEYRKLRSSLCQNNNLNETDLYKLAQACYVFLKVAYVTREAGTGILDGKLVSQEAKDALKTHLGDANQKIAEKLAILRRAACTENNKTDNTNAAFGFLPSEAENYVKTENKKQLADIIKKMDKQKETDIIKPLEGAYSAKCNGIMYDMSILYGAGNQVHVTFEYADLNNYEKSGFTEFDWIEGQENYALEFSDETQINLTMEYNNDCIDIFIRPDNQVMLMKNRDFNLTNTILAVKNYFSEYKGSKLTKSEEYTYPTEGIFGMSFGELWLIPVYYNGIPVYELTVTGYEHEEIGCASVYRYEELNNAIINDSFGDVNPVETFSVLDYFPFDITDDIGIESNDEEIKDITGKTEKDDLSNFVGEQWETLISIYPEFSESAVFGYNLDEEDMRLKDWNDSVAFYLSDGYIVCICLYNPSNYKLNGVYVGKEWVEDDNPKCTSKIKSSGRVSYENRQVALVYCATDEKYSVYDQDGDGIFDIELEATHPLIEIRECFWEEEFEQELKKICELQMNLENRPTKEYPDLYYEGNNFILGVNRNAPIGNNYYFVAFDDSCQVEIMGIRLGMYYNEVKRKLHLFGYVEDGNTVLFYSGCNEIKLIIEDEKVVSCQYRLYPTG